MASKHRKNLVGLVVCAAVFVAAPLLGIAATGLVLRRAFDGVTVIEPSRKAQVLGEGISAAMSWTAAGMVVSFPALVLGVVFAVRLARERRATSG